ncbi:hypothetical protein PVAP13_J025032 [Panicum virgatum]|jgi:hypothetical protein|nr:hypothetical protein PVAP13_J025032 [Panicum virgatum]
MNLYRCHEIDVIGAHRCSQKSNTVARLSIMRSECSKRHLLSVIPYLYQNQIRNGEAWKQLTMPSFDAEAGSRPLRNGRSSDITVVLTDNMDPVCQLVDWTLKRFLCFSN